MTEPSLLEDWLDRTERISLQNRSFLEKFSALLPLLKERKIEVFPLKGMDLLLRRCLALGRRSFVDMDLLVREKHLQKLDEFLESEGFCRRGSSQRFLNESFANESLDYVSRDRCLLLDIIWRPWYLDAGSTEALWNRSVFRETPLGPCRLLHPEDALLYLLAYAVAWRGYFSPFFVQDLQGFLQKEGAQINWRRWISEVRRCGMAGAVFCGLRYAQNEGLQGVPKEVCDALQPRSFSERWLVGYYSQLTKGKGRFSSSYISLFLGTPGWKKKTELLWRAFFPPASLVALRRGKISFWIRFLAGVFRPIRILARILYFIPRDFLRIFMEK